MLSLYAQAAYPCTCKAVRTTKEFIALIGRQSETADLGSSNQKGSVPPLSAALFLKWELEKMTMTMEVSETLERVDSIINTLDEIMATWTVYRPPKKRGFPVSPKRCAPGATSCRKLTRARKKIKRTGGFVETSRFLFAVPTTKFPRSSYPFTAGSSEP